MGAGRERKQKRDEYACGQSAALLKACFTRESLRSGGGGHRAAPGRADAASFPMHCLCAMRSAAALSAACGNHPLPACFLAPKLLVSVRLSCGFRQPPTSALDFHASKP